MPKEVDETLSPGALSPISQAPQTLSPDAPTWEHKPLQQSERSNGSTTEGEATNLTNAIKDAIDAGVLHKEFMAGSMPQDEVSGQVEKEPPLGEVKRTGKS